MPESITIRVPEVRRIVALAGAFGIVALLLLLGVALGSRLFPVDPVSSLATTGAIQQVRVNSGAVYVGRIAGSGGSYIQIAEAAIVRQADAAGPASSSAPRLVVEALTIEPYDVTGLLLIPVASVEWVTTIRPGSGLDAAYRQAITGAAASPGGSPAP